MRSLIRTVVCTSFFLLVLNTVGSAQSSMTPHEAQPVFRVFPNPNPGDDTYVSLQGFEAQDLLVVVYDMFGREIYSKIEVKENDGFLFTIASNGNKLASGVYLVTASANDRIFHQKLIVK